MLSLSFGYSRIRCGVYFGHNLIPFQSVSSDAAEKYRAPFRHGCIEIQLSAPHGRHGADIMWFYRLIKRPAQFPCRR